MTSHARIGAGLAIVAAALTACSMSALSSTDSGPNASAAPGGAERQTPAPAGIGPIDNGVILVHAAGSGAFRLCFLNELDRLPQPDSKVMPEANVVGVDVGTAVRIDPLRGAPGNVILYDEALIRNLYAPGSGTPPSCESLQRNAGLPYVDLGSVPDDLSSGVHILAVTGCPASTLAFPYTEAQCGSDYDSAKGNLTVVHKTLTGLPRVSPAILPMQVMHLAQPLESARAGRSVSVLFHDGTAAGRADMVVAPSIGLLQDPAPSAPAQLPFDGSDAGAYAAYTVRVELGPGDGGADAGVTTALEQSLADIQRLSSPRDVPPSYYAKASNYVLLLLGDPAPTLRDGGPDDDAFRKLHLLAVPVIEPKSDAGADAGDGG